MSFIDVTDALDLDSTDITLTCQFCYEETVLLVAKSDIMRYVFDGAYVQDAFPYLNADEREMIISDTCSKCFDAMFAEDEF
jgi:hypothetical protein